jgi:dihydrofolate reductase
LLNDGGDVMGKIVVTEFVSLDGVFEDPGGAENYEHGGWTFEYDRGDEGNTFKLDELMDAKVQLLGRITYEGFAEAWPTREGPFAEKLNNDPKVVVSTTLLEPQWNNTTVISSDVVERLRKLKDETDGSILVAGSGTLVETLLGADLVDELRLMVFPVVLGSGKRLFGETSDKKPMRLVDSKMVGDGVAILVYAPAKGSDTD